MLYRALADAVVVFHFAFLAYVVSGGFLGWRWPVALIPHVLAAAWGLAVVVFSLTCPLTTLEYALRKLGQENRSVHEGFIDQYVQGVIYPARYVDEVRIAVVAVVAVSWIGAASRMHRKSTVASPPSA